MTKTTLPVILACVFMFLGMSQISAQTELSNADIDKQIASISAYNNDINTNINEEVFYSHRVTINSTGNKVKFWGELSKYQENITYYFEVKNGVSTLKKVVILADVANRQSYTDFTYDDQGNLLLCYYNHDTKNNNSWYNRFYYYNKQLIIAQQSRNMPEGIYSDMFYPSQFSTETLTDGINFLRKGDNYYNVFNSLIKLQQPF